MARGRKKQDDSEDAGNGPIAMTIEQFQEGIAELTELRAALEEADEEAKAAKNSLNARWKKFKKDGADIDAAKEAIRLQKMGSDDAHAHLGNTLRYLKWLGMPVGAQADMFADDPPLSQSQQDRATEVQQTETGRLRGEAGDGPGENPWQAGTIEFQAWEKGRKAGFKTYSARQAGEKTPKAKRGNGKRPHIPHVAQNVTGSPLQ
jgi:hypothetical protein